ncbi:DUF2972 domain-containing protein [Campylobacter sp. B0100352/1]|uniref:DUF2972 domain-containing protein n=1 Tax=Campylobacter sp. B0100352/1 TaxID=2735783 RepID=UPI001D90C2B2|nr:DUF2972 domain-containing protein [Campylobacter sp. B0100352/1]
MQNLLEFIRDNLNPIGAQILLKALKNSHNENFFNFITENINIICTWLNSHEFKENYLNSPYPPLINPDCIDTDSSRYCAELAWDLNLPLPKHYKFIYISPHGVGAAAFLRYLNEGCDVLCFPSWTSPNDAKERYCIHYMYLNSNIDQYAINISELNIPNFDKFLNLLDPNAQIICGVRDPIGILKHNWGRDWTKVSRNYPRDFNLTYDYRNYIEFLTHNKKTEIKVDFEELNNGVFILNFLLRYFNQDKIYYLDMNSIIPENAFKTLDFLAQKFSFTPPPIEKQSFFKIQEFKGYIRYLFPITLYANKKDINNRLNPEIDPLNSIAITLDRPRQNEQINIIKLVIDDDLSNDIALYIQKEDLEKLTNDTQFFNAVKEYLHNFLFEIKKIDKQNELMMMKEEEVLSSFNSNKTLASKFLNIFQKEYQHLEQNRPDIINSWKYYQKFKNNDFT